VDEFEFYDTGKTLCPVCIGNVKFVRARNTNTSTIVLVYTECRSCKKLWGSKRDMRLISTGR